MIYPTTRGGVDEASISPYFRNTLLIALWPSPGWCRAPSPPRIRSVRWRGRNLLFVVMLATMMVPFPVVMVPLFVLFRELDWIGTFLPLWVPAWFGSAFSIFLLRQFYMTIPRELDDAARLDGCGHVGILVRILLPLSCRVAGGGAAALHVRLERLPAGVPDPRDQYTVRWGSNCTCHGWGRRRNSVMAASTIMVARCCCSSPPSGRSSRISTTGVKG